MSVLTVGKTNIPYEVYFSHKANHRRIEVNPEGFRLIALPDDNDENINAFLQSRKKWIYDQYDIMREKLAQLHYVHRYVSGAKIPYRGRMMMLEVKRYSENREINIHFRNKFLIDVPDWLSKESYDCVIEDNLKLWLRKRARQDATQFLKQYSKQTGLSPKGLRVRDQKHHWGLCGKNGVIHINWNLIFAPKPVLEYAVVHELCHLRHRDHSKEFWGLVAAILPNYIKSKQWLEHNEHLIGLNYVPVNK